MMHSRRPLRRCSALAILLLAVACAPESKTQADDQAPVRGPGHAVVSQTAPAVTPGAATEAREECPRIAGLDLSDLRAGKDPLEIRYTLDAPALVRLRLVDSDSPGLILRTLLDWAPRGAGPQVEVWDGLDAHGEPMSARRVSVALAAEPDAEAAVAWDWDALAALRYPEHKHWAHTGAQCRDLDVRMASPRDGETLRGTFEVCAELGESRGMAATEYHVAIYLDGRTAWDGRLPVGGPFCQAWDTRNVPDGEYRLGITLNDLHDHAGSDWVSVTISNGR